VIRASAADMAVDQDMALQQMKARKWFFQDTPSTLREHQHVSLQLPQVHNVNYHSLLKYAPISLAEFRC
jgi:hypothetical protein